MRQDFTLKKSPDNMQILSVYPKIIRGFNDVHTVLEHTITDEKILRQVSYRMAIILFTVCAVNICAVR